MRKINKNKKIKVSLWLYTLEALVDKLSFTAGEKHTNLISNSCQIEARDSHREQDDELVEGMFGLHCIQL